MGQVTMNSHNVRDNCPAESYCIEKWTSVETIRIELTRADKPILEMHGDVWHWIFILWWWTLWYTKFYPNKYFSFRRQSTRLGIACSDTDIWPATMLSWVQSWITLWVAKSSSCMIEMTMQYTMPNKKQITVPNTMPNLLWSYNTQNAVLNEVPTQTWQSWGTQLWD